MDHTCLCLSAHYWTTPASQFTFMMLSLVVYVLSTHLGPHLSAPLCTLLDHTCLTEHTKKMGSLLQCPTTFVFLHRSPPNFVCMQTIIGYYMLFQKLCCGGNKLAGIFERVDCFKLTVKFQYWSCCDTRCNRKNVVWVLKELRPLFLDL